MKRWIAHFISIILIAILAGCGGGSGPKRPWDTLAECEQENTELSLQVQRLQEQTGRLTEQVATLSALDKNTRQAALDTLDKIRIGKHSGIYDKDENGTKETLVVYLKVLDKEQDYIKAPGRCVVELCDLTAPEGEVKVKRFVCAPSYLSQNWGGTIFHSYYRIVRKDDDLEDYLLLKKPKELTLKVTFTDYYTGNVLTDQKVIVVD